MPVILNTRPLLYPELCLLVFLQLWEVLRRVNAPSQSLRERAPSSQHHASAASPSRRSPGSEMGVRFHPAVACKCSFLNLFVPVASFLSFTFYLGLILWILCRCFVCSWGSLSGLVWECLFLPVFCHSSCYILCWRRVWISPAEQGPHTKALLALGEMKSPFCLKRNLNQPQLF